MKTQWSNANDIISGINTVQAILYEKLMVSHFADLKWVKALISFKLSKAGIEHYTLLILKSAIKEIMGADIEVKLLLMLIGGYLLPAKKLLVHHALAEKINGYKTQTYNLPEMA
jgi:hypothetical protein